SESEIMRIFFFFRKGLLCIKNVFHYLFYLQIVFQKKWNFPKKFLFFTTPPPPPPPPPPPQSCLCPTDCREETYPCTRMYSVHRPIKRCIHSLCLYSLPRVYVINKEICVRTVCQQDEILMGETLNISVTNYRTCDSVGGTLVFFLFFFEGRIVTNMFCYKLFSP
uniref:Microfibril associated protein 5 n=1 Tax=Cyprinus carpio TaxID=7962 RepID=A0A8C1V3U5_CYPCA